jgi:hypothetical protein
MLVVPESSFIRVSCPAEGTNPFARMLTKLHDEFGAEVVNARDWVPDEEFSDGSHVLPHGATRYSVRLDLDVLRRVFPPAR